MINKVYIDNFRCFSNFEWEPMPFTLLLGDNGSGKTTIFNVLEILREFIVSGTPTTEAFPANTLTAWDSGVDQTIELGVKAPEGQYTYRLVIKHEKDNRQFSQIVCEQLNFDNLVLYKHDGNVHVKNDDGSREWEYPFDRGRSALPTIPGEGDNTRLTWFRNRIERLYVLSPDPLRMSALTEGPRKRPNRQLGDIAMWLQHLRAGQPEFATELRGALRETIEGFEEFEMICVGRDWPDRRVLTVDLDFESDNKGRPKKPFRLSFDQLSEGQRNLLALYTVLYGAVDKNTTIAIDEPDNYISLREIQPWLLALKDRAEDTGCQCLLISHHPELIDYLAAHCGTLFYREDGGPSRVKPFEWDGEGALLPSEIIARGWEQ